MTPAQREAALRLIAEHPTLFMNDLPDWCDDAFHLLRELLAEPVQEPDPVIQRESRGWSAADESMKDEV